MSPAPNPPCLSLLRNVISIAHAKRMKVFGVLDVLRWSDGSRDHWVMKKADLLDRDIYGRTHSEWARARNPVPIESSLLEFVYGEDMSGEAVTPFSPQVASMLSSLVEELSAYELDGIVLDYVDLMHPENGPEFNGMASGSPGQHALARQAFLASLRADSIDVAVGRSPDLRILPLQELVQGYARLQPSWRRQYLAKATDLTASLARKWTETHQGSPVWIVDSLITRRESVDCPRLKGIVSAILEPAIDFRAPCADIPAYPIIRATDRLGTLLFYGMLARGLGYETEDIFKEMVRTKWETQGVVVDFTNAGKRKNDYLRIIQPPKSGNNTGAQSP